MKNTRNIPRLKDGHPSPISARGGPASQAADIKILAQSHGPEALQALVGLMSSNDEKIVLAAAKEILIRAYGRPDQGDRDASSGPAMIVIRENPPPKRVNSSPEMNLAEPLSPEFDGKE